MAGMMIIIMIKTMTMMIIRHRWHQVEVQTQQRSSAVVSFVTSRIDQSKNRPRQIDLFCELFMGFAHAVAGGLY